MKEQRVSLSFKFALIVSLLSLLIGGTFLAVSYQLYDSQIYERYKYAAEALANEVSGIIDWDRVSHYKETGVEDEAYTETLEAMRNAASAAGAQYVFVFTPDGDETIYIFDTDESDERWLLGDRVPLDQEFDDYSQITPDAPMIGPEFFSSTYGELISTYFPSFDSKGNFVGYLGVDFAVDQYRIEQTNFITRLALATLAVAVFMNVAFFFALRKIVLRPIKEISKATDSYISDANASLSETNSISELAIHTRDEFENLTDSLKSMEKKIREHMESLVESNYRADTDRMTELLNRKAFEEKVRWAVENDEYKGHSVFILIDLDYFKNINDTYGHSVGDEALISCARALKAQSRKDDFVSRFGGDEFAIFFRSPATLDIVEKRAETLINAIRTKRVSDRFSLTASIGIAAFRTETAASYEELYEVADKALYTAKEQGRDQFVINYVGNEKSDEPTGEVVQ